MREWWQQPFVANKAETTEHSLCWTLRIANNNKLCSKYRNKNYVILDMMVLNDEIFWRFIHEFIHFLFRLFCTCCNREKAMESTEHSHCSNVITPPTPQTEEEEDVLWPQNWCRRKIQMECNLFMKIGKFDVFRKICDIIRCNNCIHNGQIDGGLQLWELTRVWGDRPHCYEYKVDRQWLPHAKCIVYRSSFHAAFY